MREGKRGRWRGRKREGRREKVCVTIGAFYREFLRYGCWHKACTSGLEEKKGEEKKSKSEMTSDDKYKKRCKRYNITQHNRTQHNMS